MTPLQRIKLSSELNSLAKSLKSNAVTGFEMINAKKRAEAIKTLLHGPDYKLFPLDEVNQAFYHTTRQSESIATQMQQQYYDVINKAIEKAQPEAKTAEQEQALNQASNELQDLYISKVKTLASSRSGVMSSFMAGRSNFNSSQANKRGNAYDKVALGFENWVENIAPNYIWLAVRQAMTEEQRNTESIEKQAAFEKKQNEKLERDANSLWRIIEPKSFPFDYSKDMQITRVNFSKDKLPSSITIAMKDGSYLTDNKIQLNKIFKNMTEILGHLEAQGKKIPTSWAEINTGT